MSDYSDVEWPEPWYEIADGRQRAMLTEELKREVTEGHILSGKTASVIGRRDDRDDVLAKIDDDEFLYAQVHLTWSRHPESDTRWPRVAIFRSFDEWKNSCRE